MKLIVGLGNPGDKYEHNRHNIGFKIADKLLDKNAFSSWRDKFSAHIAEGRIGNEKAVLVKPMTYMNESGQAVQRAAHFYKIQPEDVIVIHDELDLAPGKARTKMGGGHAGHNGLRSIQKHLGTPDFLRLRCGIGHPGDKARVHNYVLGNFSKEETSDWVDRFIETAADYFDLLLLGREEDYMTQLARFAPPPEPKPKEPLTQTKDENNGI